MAMEDAFAFIAVANRYVGELGLVSPSLAG
jgi:hypothetical protein